MSALFKTDLRWDSMPGVYIHAAVIDNLLRRDALTPVGSGAAFAICLGFAAAIAAAVMGRRHLVDR
jgi:CHASE2 domain-containing sensor protein